jgi:hypothetical protein
MRALRGDLFEITDEDPLALGADAGDPGQPFGMARADEPYVDERRQRVRAPTSQHRERHGSRRGRWVLCAAIICGAAAGIAALGGSESAQRGVAQHQTPGGSAPELSAPGVSTQRLRRQRRERRPASRRLIPDSSAGDLVATATAHRNPDANAGVSTGVPAEPLFAPHSGQREFGFER